jgi:hypothetical protein
VLELGSYNRRCVLMVCIIDHRRYVEVDASFTLLSISPFSRSLTRHRQKDPSNQNPKPKAEPAASPINKQVQVTIPTHIQSCRRHINSCKMKFSCQSNVAILSLFAAGGSDAFAPSTSTSMTSSRSTIQLQAAGGGSDLASLLNEYSGSSASSSAPAVTKVVESVASTVVPSVPTTPPAASVADNLSAINDAVAAAQSAADQAAIAAASVATKSAPVIKAAATGAAKAAATGAAAGGASLKPLIGSVFVQVDQSKVNPDLQFDATARAQENLAILKANFANSFGGLTEFAKNLNIDLPKVEGAGDGVDLSSYSSADLQAIVDSLHLQEYGGWYAAAVLAIFASQQKDSGKKEATSQFESELTQAQQKANEAASAASVAAEGAKLAKDLAMKVEEKTKKDSGKALLESSKMKKIVLEKESAEQKILELQAQVSKLTSQLEKAEDGKKKATKAVVTKKTEIEEEYPNKFVMEGDPEEDARIIELLKAMDEENKGKQAKAAVEAEKKREQEAKYVKAQKNVDKKMTKGVEAAQAKAEVVTKKKKSSAKKKSTATKAKAKTTPKKKAAPKKAAPAPATASGSDDDWTQLAESTLKRKTVAQLTEYLTGKGVSVQKSMKKADLLDAVKSL